MIGRPLLRLESVGSTMDIARTLLALGATPGTAVLAGYQTAGRGRVNRTWETPPGSAILCSFITASQRPPAHLGVLSLLWGWAVAETVEAVAGRLAAIKWPNDVLVDGRKIAGILTTGTSGPAGARQITGIGMNVRATEADLPETATSLAMLGGPVPAFDDVLMHLFSCLDNALMLAEDLDVDHLATKVFPRLAFRGEPVVIQDGDRIISGTLDGLDPDGALRLSVSDGATVRIVAGDLTRGPRRG